MVLIERKVNSIKKFKINIDRPLEITLDAPTNAGKHVMSNIESARSKRDTNDPDS